MAHFGTEVSDEQILTIDVILNELLKDSPALFVLLIDQSGSVIHTAGDTRHADLAILGTLIAGDLTASQEIARLTGQYQTFQHIIREGDLTNSLLSEAGDHFILYLQTNKSVPLGWVRMRVLEACQKLKDIKLNPPNHMKPLEVNEKPSNLSDLAGDALDSLWIN